MPLTERQTPFSSLVRAGIPCSAEKIVLIEIGLSKIRVDTMYQESLEVLRTRGMAHTWTCLLSVVELSQECGALLAWYERRQLQRLVHLIE